MNNSDKKNYNFGAIILAAGKGKRMNSKDVNKVALHLADKPMILHAVHLLKKIGVKSIVVVVGFAKESVLKILDGNVILAEQKKRLGTAHAVLCGLKKMPEKAENILVLNGDDSAFYTENLINKLSDTHAKSNASFTLLTIHSNNPSGLGRVVRGKIGEVLAIVEEKDATKKQKEIKEVNPGCYIFKKKFLNNYLRMVKKSPFTGEYYLTSLIDIGIKHREKIETLRAGEISWRGVNTKDELRQAERLFFGSKIG